ncbi:MAG: aspartate/glutamate racemase family protein, partial [Patescibacteria group bacterium]
MIGIFDSGLGGLTILKSILTKLPHYNYIYLGDTARAPYGNKSQTVIYGYAKEAVDFLFARGCKLIIIACNTASSKALRQIQQEYLPAKYPASPAGGSDKKVLGVIRPLVEEIASNDKIQRIGILGTRATVESNAYFTELHNLKPNLEVFQ